jgi:hypothetical protein
MQLKNEFEKCSKKKTQEYSLDHAKKLAKSFASIAKVFCFSTI